MFNMSQLHFYVPDDLEKELRKRAARARMPLSRYLAEVVKREARAQDEWPEGYFERVFGAWEGDPLERAAQGEYEKRLRLK